jgi:hypothetical protein
MACVRPASVHRLIARMPYHLRIRFDALGRFVRSIVDEQEADTPCHERLTADEIQVIKLAVFLHFLNLIFSGGMSGLDPAVHDSAGLGMEQRLAKELRGLQIGRFTVDLIRKTRSMRPTRSARPHWYLRA